MERILAYRPAMPQKNPISIKEIFFTTSKIGFSREDSFSSMYTGRNVMTSKVAGNTNARSIPDVTPTNEIICDRLGIEIAMRAENFKFNMFLCVWERHFLNALN